MSCFNPSHPLYVCVSVSVSVWVSLSWFFLLIEKECAFGNMDIGGGNTGFGQSLHRLVEPYVGPLDRAISRLAPKLLPVARICILSTYFEDGLRMILQRNEQARYFKHTWRCGYTLANLFVLVNMILQVSTHMHTHTGREPPGKRVWVCAVGAVVLAFLCS